MADSKKLIYDIVIKEDGTFIIEKLNVETKDAAVAFEALNKNIRENAKESKLSASAMLAQINQLKQLRNANTTNNKLFRKQTEDIRLLENEYKKLTLVTQQQTDKTGLASATLVEFSRGVQDANYGFRGVANNLSQLTTLMTTLIGTTGGLKNAWVALKEAFTGPIGFLVVANLVIAALERLEIVSQKATKTTDEYNDALTDADGLLASLQRYADISRDANRSDEERTVALQRLADEGYDEATGSIDDFLDAKRKLALFNATESVLQEEEKEFLAERIKLNRQLKQAEEDVIAEQKRMSDANLTPYSDVGGNITILKDDIKRIQKLLTENQTEIDKISNEIVDSFNKTSEELKDNPFYELLFGVKEDKDRTKRSKRLKTVSEFTKKEEDTIFDSLQRQLDGRKAVDDFKQELHDNEIDRLNAELDKREELASIITSQVKKLSQIQTQAFAAQIKRLDTERDVILNNDNLTAEEKDRLLKKNDAETRKIRTKQIKFQRDMMQIEMAMELAKIGLQLQNAMTTVIVDGTGAITKATMSIGEFMKQLGPVGIAAYAASIGGVIATIISARKKAQQQIQALSSQSLAVSGGGGSAAPQIQAPAFNVVGATQTSQLAQTISQAEDKPIKAFVVASDVSTAQELERSTIEGASIG
jgi:hypothetical protein